MTELTFKHIYKCTKKHINLQAIIQIAAQYIRINPAVPQQCPAVPPKSPLPVPFIKALRLITCKQQGISHEGKKVLF
jgi:hypothetical protein